MDVETVQALGETSEFSLDSALLTLNLGESDNTVDTRVTILIKNADSVVSVLDHVLNLFFVSF